jgi:hypothetical protein
MAYSDVHNGVEGLFNSSTLVSYFVNLQAARLGLTYNWPVIRIHLLATADHQTVPIDAG